MNDKLDHEQQAARHAKGDTEQSNKGYSKGFKWLHWLMAILVILMFMATFGFAQANTDDARIEMLTGHSSMGSLIFLLFVIRFSKRFIFKSPRPNHNLDTMTAMAAKVGHLSLYLLLFYVPVTGYLSARAHELPVYWFGQLNIAQLSGYNQGNFDMLRNLHELGVQTLMIFVVVHIAAAIFHGVAKKDGVFSSMWPGRKSKV